MRTPIAIVAWLGAAAMQTAGEEPAPSVVAVATPHRGLQPVAASSAGGDVHVVFFSGEPASGDLFHVVRRSGSDSWSDPVRVNSTDGGAIAVGTIRGAHLALGRNGTLHVVWNGSARTTPDGDRRSTPMLYTRSTDGGNTFQPERDLIRSAYGLDGGGAVAAGPGGRVEVFWHAGEPDAGEPGRQVWVARSSDDGVTFAAEQPAWNRETGVCGCCGMTAQSAADGSCFALYRSASGGSARDVYLLRSPGSAGSDEPFAGRLLDRWETESCPMSAMALDARGGIAVAAWEAADGGIGVARIDGGGAPATRVSKGGAVRKVPDVAVSPDGHILVTWVDGAGWERGGTLGWQLFSPAGEPAGAPETGPATAVWSKPAAVFDGERFLIVY